jgi:hypothetical protein
MNHISPRAKRRHQVTRIKAKCRQRSTSVSIPASEKARHIGMLAKSRTLCSCWMCGNPRKYLGERSVQERRALQLGRVRRFEGE